MKRFFLSALALSSFFAASAQQHLKVPVEATDKLIKDESGIVGTPIQGTFIGFTNPPSIDQTFKPTLFKVSDNESEDNELKQRIMEEKDKLKDNYNGPRGSGEKTTTTVAPPIVGVNFAGLNNSGIYTPLDNTIAISDKDTIVAMINTSIGYYTATGTLIYSHDIWSMLGDGSITNSLCDPKIIWDNVARRFFFYTQVCDKTSANSLVIISVSKSSNPMNGWYHYKFTGNPLNNGCFFDYPKLAVSTDEIFVTGNLFSATSGNYSTSIIYQIQKAPMMAGSTLTTANSKYYQTNNFTPLPVGYGQNGSYGPGIYLVSTGGVTSGSTSYKLLDITNNIASGTAVLNSYNVSTGAFSTATSAKQQGSTQKLDMLDCRAMDGFYLHGTVHFVFTKDMGSGYGGTSYHRLTVSTLADVNASLSNVGTSDYSFPAIASPAYDSTDPSILMSFNESGSGFYPRTCVVRCDRSMTWSAPVVVKAGLGYVAYPGTAGPIERWGDYNGMCKRFHDSTNSVWLAGMYGNSSPNNDWLQWIAKINPYRVGVETITPEEPVKATVYPNPVTDFYKVKFSVPERQHLTINLTDMQGRTVAELYDGIAEEGENIFSFNKASLTSGIYSLNIIGATTNIRNEKIVVAGN